MPIFSTHFLRPFVFYFSIQFVLFGEIVLAQKVMYEKFGDDFLVHFVSKGFSSAHCPPDLAEQYRQKLQVFKVYGAEMFIVYLSSPAEIIKKYWGRNIIPMNMFVCNSNFRRNKLNLFN